MEKIRKQRFVVDLSDEEIKKLDELTVILLKQGKITRLSRSKVMKEYLLERAYITLTK